MTLDAWRAAVAASRPPLSAAQITALRPVWQPVMPQMPAAPAAEAGAAPGKPQAPLHETESIP